MPCNERRLNRLGIHAANDSMQNHSKLPTLNLNTTKASNCGLHIICACTSKLCRIMPKQHYAIGCGDACESAYEMRVLCAICGAYKSDLCGPQVRATAVEGIATQPAVMCRPRDNKLTEILFRKHNKKTRQSSAMGGYHGIHATITPHNFALLHSGSFFFARKLWKK